MPPRKKILVLGAKGMLGTDMVGVLVPDFDVKAIDIEDLDITKEAEAKDLISKICPNVVINCAAYTDVDGCELDIKKAFAVNAEAVKNIAQGCKQVNAKLVQFSTDYVFNGDKRSPYEEGDAPDPLNIYGRSKLAGEKYAQEITSNHLLIRTSWLFGGKEKNFVAAILKLARQQDELKIVDDQIGSPTYTVSLAQATRQLVAQDKRGLFHVSNRKHCSWYEFARQILQMTGNKNIKVLPISSKECARLANRPKNSVLNCNKLHQVSKYRMPDWEAALQNYLDTESIFLK